jgi:hypothetical protein
MVFKFLGRRPLLTIAWAERSAASGYDKDGPRPTKRNPISAASNGDASLTRAIDLPISRSASSADRRAWQSAGSLVVNAVLHTHPYRAMPAGWSSLCEGNICRRSPTFLPVCPNASSTFGLLSGIFQKIPGFPRREGLQASIIEPVGSPHRCRAIHLIQKGNSSKCSFVKCPHDAGRSLLA